MSETVVNFVKIERVNISITENYKAQQKIEEGKRTKKCVAEEYGGSHLNHSDLKDLYIGFWKKEVVIGNKNIFD